MVVLDRQDVMRCAGEIDPAELVAEVLRQHGRGHTLLPAEGYLSWQNSRDQYSRSLAMLGAVTPPAGRPSYGVKLINASVGNPDLGIERAGGFTVLFDPETARPRTLVEAGYLSALRTAAYTVCSLQALGPLARVHVELLRRYFPEITTLRLYDIDRARAAALAEQLAVPGIELPGTAREAFRDSQVVITLTVSDTPYAEADWIAPGSFLCHVSLDDLGPSVFAEAAAIYVDDLELVMENPRRILGQLLADGRVQPKPGPGGITGSLPEVLLGRCEAIRPSNGYPSNGYPSNGYVVSNPFGMAILDIGLVSAVADLAQARGLGRRIDLIGGS
jgi:ornithine cyclodeaminase